LTDYTGIMHQSANNVIRRTRIFLNQNPFPHHISKCKVLKLLEANKIVKTKLYEYTFDYIGVRTVKAKTFEEARNMADFEVPVNFTVELCETNDPLMR